MSEPMQLLLLFTFSCILKLENGVHLFKVYFGFGFDDTSFKTSKRWNSCRKIFPTFALHVTSYKILNNYYIHRIVFLSCQSVLIILYKAKILVSRIMDIPRRCVSNQEDIKSRRLLQSVKLSHIFLLIKKAFFFL